jgi:hypothetical protein
MAVEYVDNGNDDGTNFGASDSLIGFYGLAAPIVKPSFTQAAIVTTAATTAAGTSTALWAYASSQPDAIIAIVNELRAKLVAAGLVTT